MSNIENKIIKQISKSTSEDIVDDLMNRNLRISSMLQC